MTIATAKRRGAGHKKNNAYFQYLFKVRFLTVEHRGRVDRGRVRFGTLEVADSIPRGWPTRYFSRGSKVGRDYQDRPTDSAITTRHSRCCRRTDTRDA